MKNNEVAKLRKLVSDDIWELFIECDVLIAGGAITSVHTNKDVNDLDIYFKSPEMLYKFIQSNYYSELDEDSTSNFKLSQLVAEQTDICSSEFSIIFTNITDKSLLGIDSQTGQAVQLIIYKIFPTVDDIFNDFDFTVCMGAYSPKEDKFYLHENFLKHNSQRYLEVNTKTSYPLISALRIRKYEERGYKISKAQTLKLLLRISEMKISTWKELKESIGGLYGLNMNEVFDEKVEFSIQNAIEILHNLESDNTFEIMHARSIPKYEIVSKLEPLFGRFDETDERESVSGRYFKNVLQMTDGRLISHWTSMFEYKFGEDLDGGSQGIFVYDGVDVLRGIYKSQASNVIIEILPLSDSIVNEVKDSDNPKKYTIVGKCIALPKVYTKEEFKRKFKK